MFCRKAAHLNSHCQDYGSCPDYSSFEDYGICIHETETRWILTVYTNPRCPKATEVVCL